MKSPICCKKSMNFINGSWSRGMGEIIIFFQCKICKEIEYRRRNDVYNNEENYQLRKEAGG